MIFLFWISFESKINANPSDTIVSIRTPLGKMLFDTYQDKSGYLWIASSRGVTRYNGSRFDHYTMEDGLSDSNIFSFYEDKRNRIWVCSYNGRPSYFQNGKWRNEDQISWLKEISNYGPIQSITEYQSDLVIVCSKKIFFIDENNTVRGFTPKGLHPAISSFKAVIKKQGDLILIADCGFFQMQTKTYLKYPSSVHFINQNTKVTYWKELICVSHDRRVYFFDQKLQLKRIYETEERDLILRVGILHVKNSSNRKEEESSLVVCTERSVLHFDSVDQKKPELYLKDITWPSSVGADRDGNIWVTSLTSGLHFRAKKSGHQVKVPFLPSNDWACRLEVVNGILWVGTQEGRIYNSVKNGTHERSDSQSLNFVAEADYSESFRRVRFFKTKGGLIYVGMDGAMMMISSAGSPVKIYKGSTKALQFLDSDSVLIARAKNLVKRKLVKNQDPNQEEYFKGERIVLEEQILCFYGKGSDTLWLGTRNGLKLLVGLEKRPLSYKGENIVGQPKSITQILPADSQRLLIGTENDGLFYFDGVQFQKIITDEPFKSNSIYQILPASILKDRNGRGGEWWVCSNNGLFNLLLKNDGTLLLKKFDTGVSIQGAVYSAAEYQGRLWLAADNGVYAHELELPKKTTSRVYWERVQVENRTINVGSSDSMFQFGARENTLRLQFTSFWYGQKEQLIYQYKVEPSNQNWQPIGGEELVLQELAPGRYNISMRVKHPGLGFGDPSTLIIVIEKPFWMRWWFIMAIGLGAMLGLYFIIKKRERRLIKFAEEKQTQLEWEKEKISLTYQLLLWQQEAEKLQFKPHFLFNAIYSLQGYYGSGKIQEGKAFADKFSGLLRSQLKFFGKKYISLSEEILWLKSYSAWRNMRLAHPVLLRIDVNEVEQEIYLPVMLIQPILENCYDHAFLKDEPHKEIKVHFSFQKAKNYLEVRMEDNGVGKVSNGESSAQKISLNVSNNMALQLIKKRLDLLNSILGNQLDSEKPLFDIQFGIDTQTGGGCRVILKIPCNFDPHAPN